MNAIVGRLAIGAGALVLMVAFRRQLVAVLTMTTGTWVGTPGAPTSLAGS